ncbi:MAG: response regulator [Chitinivibrionia bacterium]|nr:response regulator [Chitinivibrionia bacterium]
MNRLLFVDTSPQNLAAYSMLFVNNANEWECRFVDSIKTAFDELSYSNFDMVVTDIKMPVLNGVPLLETIAQMYPDIIRVVLIPSLSADYPKHFVKYAHRMLVRPDSYEKLEVSVSRIFHLYKAIMRPQAIRFIDGLETVPSLPKVYGELVAELESPQPSVKKAGALVAADIGMSASILKMVNSAYFGLSEKVTSPEFAVSLLGLDIVQGLVLTAHLFSAFSSAETKLLQLETVVDHCLITGFLAKEIAKHENLPTPVVDALHISGILHDVGQLIFASHSPKLYRQVIDIATKENRPLFEIEQELFGATHSEIGAYLLGQWGLPESVIEFIAYHHTDETPDYINLELSILKAADFYSKKVLPKTEVNAADTSEKIFEKSEFLNSKKEEWGTVCVSAIQKSTMKI